MRDVLSGGQASLVANQTYRVPQPVGEWAFDRGGCGYDIGVAKSRS